jgi:hypothetical protein
LKRNGIENGVFSGRDSLLQGINLQLLKEEQDATENGDGNSIDV